MRRLCLLLILTLLIIANCPGCNNTASESIATEEYAVYRAVIEALYLHERTERIVVMASTGIGLFDGGLNAEVASIRDRLQGVEADTLRDYREKNNELYPLDDAFGLDIEVVLLTDQALQAFFEEGGGGWDAFYARYPQSQGVMTVSRVGFNRAGNQALVYVGNQSHYLAGAGHYLLLALEDGAWVIQDRLMAWIS